MTAVNTVLDHLQTGSSLTIICHSDPDPDSLSSAIALELLAIESGIETVDILYGGTISHQQNRAFVDRFEIEPKRYSEALLYSNEISAFVDHSLPGNHNPVPEGTHLDLVVDHHPSAQPVPAAITDVREEYGATATILAEYFRDSHIEITPRVASALLFGIHRERLDFYQQPTDREYELTSYLHSRADVGMLRDLYGASFLPSSVDAIGNVIHNRVRRGSVLVSCIGRLENRVALAQAADFLLLIEGIDTVLVCGIVRDELRLSGRTIRPEFDLGVYFTQVFGDLGDVGGHDDMAGGQLPVAAFDTEAETDVELVAAIRKRIEDRFFDAL
ncbi:bifunctional oligoribonuclease/PAP phosphatase NrnA [Natronococcus pandeyae]|uniref:Bifunctional oligoribonuclease/PAP phosphatase NrnA n=1 Tax=Natronococcus pandeyae TaxID=2055836 RepID=A0A8J8Q0X3_9EURY|nr:bifunctional oligoribonuclease/PAP phosphatase NrnA [Natronococcus pandeyae]TYL36942.1 bifunctional oligoribonuclease/PAP phosphatase NrnA [Natronococcus pandeyae]